MSSPKFPFKTVGLWRGDSPFPSSPSGLPLSGALFTLFFFSHSLFLPFYLINLFISTSLSLSV